MHQAASAVAELERVKRALGKLPGVDLAIVFGSVARGEAHVGSDIDVAILGAASPIEVSAVVSDAAGRDAQVVELAHASIPLLESIVDDGVVVHERSPGAAAAWRSRALLELELERPWYGRQCVAWLKKVAERGL